MKSRLLYVPSDVSLRNEVWSGLSVRDALVSLLVAGVAAGIAVVLAAVWGVPLVACVLGVLLSGVACVGLLNRIPGLNRSMLDQIGIGVSFAKSQKRYFYVYRREGE